MFNIFLLSIGEEENDKSGRMVDIKGQFDWKFLGCCVLYIIVIFSLGVKG